MKVLAMSALSTLLAALAITGQSGTVKDDKDPRPNDPSAKTPPPSDSFKPDAAWNRLGQDIWFDPKEKRLVIRSRVALQDGALELLLTTKNFKEHESILATEAPAQMIHAGLILTGAKEGHPVRFQPKFEPPAGSAIAIELEWEQAGKLKKVDAREWVKDQATGASLSRDWVFAGSELFEDPRTKTPIYAADDGDLITVANFPSSILDLPYRSSANDGDRSYVSRADRVPVRGTPVTMYLKPRPAPAKPETKPKPEPAVKPFDPRKTRPFGESYSSVLTSRPRLMKGLPICSDKQIALLGWQGALRYSVTPGCRPNRAKRPGLRSTVTPATHFSHVRIKSASLISRAYSLTRQFASTARNPQHEPKPVLVRHRRITSRPVRSLARGRPLG